VLPEVLVALLPLWRVVLPLEVDVPLLWREVLPLVEVLPL
jgi:hypothetical protein